MLGSVDSNTGSPDLGWDTDQFPMDIRNTTLVMKVHFFKLTFIGDIVCEGDIVQTMLFKDKKKLALANIANIGYLANVDETVLFKAVLNIFWPLGGSRTF